MINNYRLFDWLNRQQNLKCMILFGRRLSNIMEYLTSGVTVFYEEKTLLRGAMDKRFPS